MLILVNSVTIVSRLTHASLITLEWQYNPRVTNLLKYHTFANSVTNVKKNFE